MYPLAIGLSRGLAYLGGVALVAVILMTCLSILGRSATDLLHSEFLTHAAPGLANWLLELGVGPVTGDFELVEVGVAFAVFSFMPLCQMTAGHAAVDIFTSRLPDRFDRVLQLLIDAVFAVVWLIIAVQLSAGMISKLRSGQTTLLLEYPVWWGYAACLSGASVAAAVALYVAIVRLMELAQARDILPRTEGAEH